MSSKNVFLKGLYGTNSTFISYAFLKNKDLDGQHVKHIKENISTIFVQKMVIEIEKILLNNLDIYE